MSPHTAVFPSSWLASPWYATLTAFVAVNTLIYVVLSISKILPRAHPATWFRGKGASRRRESRSIYPPIGPTTHPPTYPRGVLPGPRTRKPG